MIEKTKTKTNKQKNKQTNKQKTTKTPLHGERFCIVALDENSSFISFEVRARLGKILQLKNDNLHVDYTLDNFDLMFGVSDDSLVTFLILCCKFYIYRCKFQEVSPNFVAFKRFLLTKRKTEYCIAYKKGKLSNHFKKWAFDI